MFGQKSIEWIDGKDRKETSFAIIIIIIDDYCIRLNSKRLGTANFPQRSICSLSSLVSLSAVSLLGLFSLKKTTHYYVLCLQVTTFSQLSLRVSRRPIFHFPPSLFAFLWWIFMILMMISVAKSVHLWSFCSLVRSAWIRLDAYRCSMARRIRVEFRSFIIVEILNYGKAVLQRQLW